MAPNIKFYVDNGLSGNFDLDLANTGNGQPGGLGFYGSGGFGSTVAVGQYQDNTFATNGTGAVQGPQANNVKYISASGGYVGTAGLRHVKDITNAEATMNIKFDIDNTGTPVQVQNAKLYIYDRVAIANAATGVITQVYETIHTATGITGLLGSGASTWTACTGTGNSINLSTSPGLGGTGAGGVNPSTVHDWYVCISSSPQSIGSKSAYGLYCSLEYL